MVGHGRQGLHFHRPERFPDHREHLVGAESAGAHRGVQEFLVITPEPGTFAMVARAMFAPVITLFRRGLLSA
jgi:hypothetical protein